jgi:phenylacetate-CoA ligase
MIHYGRKEDVIECQNKSVSFYELQEAVYTLGKVPFMWKMKISSDRVKFLCQFIEPAGETNISTIKHELSEKLGFEIDSQQAEIIPLERLTEKPDYRKYAYIERERINELEVLAK